MSIFQNISYLFIKPAYAALTPLVQCGPGTAKLECTICDLFQLAQNVYNFVIVFAFILALGALVWAGFKMMTSAGDPAKYKDALGKIRTILIGLAILLLAGLIVDTVLKVIVGGSLGPWNKLPC